MRCLETDALAITAQNHNYAVDAGSLQDTGLRITHVDILDDTVEGLDCEEDRLLTAQYCPESAPGVANGDTRFDRFVQLMKEAGNHA